MNDDNNIKLSKTGVLIKSKLAEHLGVSPEDIANDDFLKDDLHMSPAEISDFIMSLKSHEIEIDVSKLAGIESFLDLVEAATEDEGF